MRRLWYLLSFLLLAGALLLTVGCGSSSNTTSNQPPGNQPPGNQPPPGGTPPPASATQYEAALLRPGSTGAIAAGQIFVNANSASGAGKVTATGGAKSASYTITFRPFTNSGNPIQVGSV